MSTFDGTEEAEMDRTGIYILSHKQLDENSDEKKPPEPGFVNEGYNAAGDGDASVQYKSQDGVSVDRHYSDAPYRGMGKEDLLRHSSKPLWRRLRYICMSIVLLGWLALIITVVALVLIYPRCRDPRQQRWWQKTVVYRIYVPSFQDTDGDGIGDINGITSRLGYLKEIGAGTLSLSPIFQTKAGAETDFDITDHKEIDRRYGTMTDLENLLSEAHNRGIKVTLDFIPNLTSDEHKWFKSSVNQTEKKNYYVWQPGVSGGEPNNWKSVYNGPAWKQNAIRGEHYLHQFRPDQPDLNLRSAEVQDDLKSILMFWLEKGVDGFFVRQSGNLFEDYDLRDEERSSLNTTSNTNDYAYYNHTYTYGLPEINDMLARWRYFLDEYGNKTKQYRMLFADIDGDVDKTMNYYGYFNRDGVDFPLNRFCLTLKEADDGSAVSKVVSQWLDNLPAGRWANWMGGDDSSKRIAGRLGANMTRAFVMLSMLLPGTPFHYYGDEIGLPDSSTPTSNPWEQRQPMRAPMRWDNSTNGGFLNTSACGSTCNPWAPVIPVMGDNSVNNQNASMESMLHLFKNLTKLRGMASFQYGDYYASIMDDSVVSFVREFDGEKGFLVAINFGSKEEKRKYTGTHDTIPGSASVELTTGNGVALSSGDSPSLSDLPLGPYQGVVVSWDYVAKEL